MVDAKDVMKLRAETGAGVNDCKKALAEAGGDAGKAKDLLDGVQAKLGVTPNIMRTMAHSPALLQSYLQFGETLGGGSLSAKLREQLATAIAGAGGMLADHDAIQGGFIYKAMVFSAASSIYGGTEQASDFLTAYLVGAGIGAMALVFAAMMRSTPPEILNTESNAEHEVDQSSSLLT